MVASLCCEAEQDNNGIPRRMDKNSKRSTRIERPRTICLIAGRARDPAVIAATHLIVARRASPGARESIRSGRATARAWSLLVKAQKGSRTLKLMVLKKRESGDAAPSIIEGRAMNHYVAIDVSLKVASVCVVDGNGNIACEGKIAVNRTRRSHG